MAYDQIRQTGFHSIPRQIERLNERRGAASLRVRRSDMDILVHPGVYQTSVDSELMAESVEISRDENFLEIGCGTGIVSLAIAKKAKTGLGVDINELAVKNSLENAALCGISNVQFLRSDLFENVTGSFDVVICNPPYTNHTVRDDIERMFWDPEDDMKKRFFLEVDRFCRPNGKIYFGWADFADIDVDLPFRLAALSGHRLVNVFRKSRGPDVTFYVLEFQCGALLT